MGKLKALQAKYKAGEITKAEYMTQLKALLDGEYIEQDTYDEALTLDPEADKPIYTQADVDKMILPKATKLVRKQLKDAGIEIDADNNGFMAKVVEMVKVGAGKTQPPAAGAEFEALKVKAAKADTIQGELKRVKVENALLKSIGKYKPVSTQAVVTLLTTGDYAGLLELDDENGVIDQAAIKKAVSKLQANEPGLFQVDNGGDDDQNRGQGGDDNQFRSKGPGGGGSGGNNKDKDFAKKLEEAKGMITVIPKQQQK